RAGDAGAALAGQLEALAHVEVDVGAASLPGEAGPGGGVDDGILVQEHRRSLQATLRLCDAPACREHGGGVLPGDLERARQAEQLGRSGAWRRQVEEDGGEYELSEREHWSPLWTRQTNLAGQCRSRGRRSRGDRPRRAPSGSARALSDGET